jgi:hypothetical protein
MRATLHDHAPNTYYGQWLAKDARKRAAKWGPLESAVRMDRESIFLSGVDKNFFQKLMVTTRRILMADS